MKRVWSSSDLDYYTYMRDVLADLQLDKKDYLWLISDIDAYSGKNAFVRFSQLIADKSYLLLTTSELIGLLDDDDIQWVWAVFSAIPAHYKEADILNFELPHIAFFTEEQYNPYDDVPKLQHPYAELEIYCSESGLALVSADNELIDRFRKCYPGYTDYFAICYHSLKAYIKEYTDISNKI